MKPKVFFSLMLLILSTFLYVSDTTAENEPYTQWSLPDGAKARLGKGGVNDITCSPDGTLLVVASQIGIWIYDIQTGKEIALLTGHAVAVDRVAFSPDRRTLASGGQDNTVRLWDVNTQTEIATLEGHTGGPDSIWFSPDGRILASRGNDNTLRLWDVDTQMQIRTLEGHTGSVESVAFSPDGKTLANGGQDNIVRLWDVETRTEISTLQGHAGYARSVSFSPDGRTLASGSNDIRLWDMETQTQIGRLEGHTGLVNSVAFSPDGRTLVSGSSWGEVHLWDMETQTRSSILEGSSFRHITGVSFSPDGNTIAYKYPWVTDSVSFLNVNTLSRSSGGFFEHTWEVLWVIDTLVDAQRKNIHTILQGHTGTVESISFSPDGRTIAASGVDNYNFIRMWDIASLTEINILDRWDYRFSNKNVSFSPDGKRILSRCGQYVICLRDAATYTEISRLEIPSNWWVSIAVFSPDGRTLAILSHDHESPIYGSPIVRLWNVDTDTEIGELWGHIGQVQSVSFSPDGRTLATAGSIDGTVRLWDVDTLAEIAILRGHTGWVNSVAFNPDGRTIVSGDQHGTVRLWDVATLTSMGILEGHTYAVNSVSFSPGGKTIASGSDDGTVLLWNITSVDHGNTLLEATTLLLGGSLTAQIDPDTDVDYFSIPIEVRGQLTLWTTTTGSLDMIGTLQNSKGTPLATNAENVDEALGFRIEHIVEPGTYYIKVESHEQQIGDYTLYAVFIPATDVNADGVVDVLDLVIVAENFGRFDTPLTGDVNGDGEVDREDIIAVLDAIDAAAAAPAAVSTTESLQRWIDQAKQLNRTDARFQKGIAVLQHLLTTLRNTETVPKATALLANYPNPFNPETWIPYQLANPADVTLAIYRVNGALVRTLSLGHQPAGMYHSRSRAAYWDGRNQIGEPVASGLYFYTLTAGNFSATRKLLIRK